MSLANMTLTDKNSWTNAKAQVNINWNKVRLKVLDAEVNRYLGNRKRKGVDSALYAVKTKDDTLWTAGEALFAWLFAELNRRSPVAPTKVSGGTHFGSTVGGAINALGAFACSDVLTWPGNIRSGHKARVLMRYYLTDKVKARKEARANASALCLGKYRKTQLKTVHDLIQAAESACCTTFAMTGAHILLSKGVTSRVELVAVPATHCLIVVGRVGGLVRGKVPGAHTWGSGAIVIDPWLASLGHEAIFSSPGSYPYPGWLSGLEQNFDSKATNAPFNPFANVRLRRVNNN